MSFGWQLAGVQTAQLIMLNLTNIGLVNCKFAKLN